MLKNISTLILLFLFFSCFMLDARTSLATNSKEKNELILILNSEPQEGFDPTTGWGATSTPLFQSTLVYFHGKNLELAYDFATSYNISDNSLVWTFKLRDDVYCSDGTKLSASDVAFTFNKAKNSASMLDLTELKSVKALDETTVEFTLHKPQITFLHSLAKIGIVPQKLYDENYSQKPVGSGPFTLLQWDKGQQAILGINDKYYGKKPELSKIIILFMDENSAFNAMKAGLADISYTSQNLALNKLDSFKLLRFKTIDNRGITMPVLEHKVINNKKVGNDITADIAIRRALSYGIDREKLVQDSLNGFGVPAFSECDSMPWANDASIVSYDLDFAIKLLNQAGWTLEADDKIRKKNGKKAEFTLLYAADREERQAIAYAISEQAKELGINIIVKGASWDQIEKEMLFTPIVIGWGSQNPLETYLLYHSSNKGLDYYNPENYSNKIVDGYLEKAMSEREESRAYEQLKLSKWDGKTGTSTQGDTPLIWYLNIDHLFFADKDLIIPEQKIHPHEHGWIIVSNLKDWKWSK